MDRDDESKEGCIDRPRDAEPPSSDVKYVENAGQQSQSLLSCPIPQSSSQPLRGLETTPAQQILTAEADHRHPPLGGGNNLSMQGLQEGHSNNNEQSLPHSIYGQTYMVGGTNSHLASNSPMNQLFLQYQLSEAGLGRRGYPSSFGLGVVNNSSSVFPHRSAGASQSSSPTNNLLSRRMDAEQQSLEDIILASQQPSLFLNREAAAAATGIPDTTLPHGSVAARPQQPWVPPEQPQQQRLGYQNPTTLTMPRGGWRVDGGGATSTTRNPATAWLRPEPHQQVTDPGTTISYAASTAMREERGGKSLPGQQSILEEGASEKKPRSSFSPRKRIRARQKKQAEDGSFTAEEQQHTLAPETTQQGPPAAAAARAIARENEDLPISEQLRKLERPSRALTAYNLFFQQERSEMIDRLPAAVVSEEQPTTSSSPSSKKKKSQTGISFEVMARKIAARWNGLSDEERRPFEKQAKIDKRRHKREMKVFDAQQEELRLSHLQKLSDSVDSDAWENYCKEQSKKCRRKKL